MAFKILSYLKREYHYLHISYVLLLTLVSLNSQGDTLAARQDLGTQHVYFFKELSKGSPTS